MEYYEEITIKDGRNCILRNAEEKDCEAVLDIFNLTHTQTDYLLSYPDESGMTFEGEAQFLKEKAQSADGIEILAQIEGEVAGLAGIGAVGAREKVRHRAEFGISIDRKYWGLGIGRALTKACIECAKKAGYVQLELDVVAENKNAIALYQSEGFTEYGRNPKGFRSRHSGWQEVVLMRLELDK